MLYTKKLDREPTVADLFVAITSLIADMQPDDCREIKGTIHFTANRDGVHATLTRNGIISTRRVPRKFAVTNVIELARKGG